MERISQVSPKRLRLQEEIFRCSLSNAKASASSDLEAAARWSLLSAEIADTIAFDALMLAELETLLLKIAMTIPAPKRENSFARRRWLHVFSEVPHIGGHTALATRWIALDSGDDQHSLVITYQDAPDVPEMMKEAIEARDGKIHVLGTIKSLYDRSCLLREIAWREADVVVLHTNMSDIVPLVAFGVPGGPPVLLLNHADHTFWVGAAIADQVIHIRESGKEVAEKYRGITRHSYLPIPLTMPEADIPNIGRIVREKLCIPENAPVFLTVGSHFKYLPIGATNFINTACRLLKETPNAYLIAVGPSTSDPDWERARSITGGRLMAVGPQYELAKYFAASDVYIEGFPFGSLTALLEAGLAGLACVRAPMQCPPPFTSDGEALEHIPQPRDTEEYISQAAILAASSLERKTRSKALKKAIERVHLGKGWQSFLDEIKANLPHQHEIYQVSAQTTPLLWQQYWLPFMVRRFDGDPLLFFYVRGHRIGLKPRPSARMLAAAYRAAVPEHPPGTPGPIALALWRPLIDPIASTIPFNNKQPSRKRWPKAVLDYWYNHYIGWRFKPAGDSHISR